MNMDEFNKKCNEEKLRLHKLAKEYKNDEQMYFSIIGRIEGIEFAQILAKSWLRIWRLKNEY